MVAFLMIGISFLGFWLGAQNGAEEMYIKDCMDKHLAASEVKNLTAIQICGSVIGCLVAYPL